MNNIILILSYGVMFVGLFFIITTVVGLIRIRNIYQMLHIITINDMLGVPLFLLGLSGLCFIKNQNILAIKIVFLIIISYCVTVINSYIIVKILYFLKNQKS